MAEEHKVMTLASWVALVLYIVMAAGPAIFFILKSPGSGNRGGS